MDTGLPRKRAVKKAPQEATNEIVSKYFLPFAAAITSAIFYYTGWVYLAHWYGFFGIDATQINIPIQVILLHGVPGILVLVISVLIPIILQSIWSSITEKTEPRAMDIIPIVIFSGVFIPVVLTLLVLPRLSSQMEFPRPIEVDFSVYGEIVFLLAVIVQVARNMRDLARKAPKMNAMSLYFNAYSDLTPSGGTLTAPPLQVAFIIIYFFVSISTSAVLGEWDAARGGRLMIGDWHIPGVAMYSTARIPSLANKEIEIDANKFEYNSLGLLASDDKVYYLVDLKTTYYYRSKPDLYIIPRSDSLTLNFIVSPYTLATPTPSPTASETPSLTPTIIFTPTP